VNKKHLHLTRRERQIMDVIYRHGAASVADVRAEMPDPPSYSAVRAMLRLLEEKGHVRHKKDGARYVYQPIMPRQKARRFALKSLLSTFFDNSAEQAVAALLDMSANKLNDDDLKRLSRLIDDARLRGG
jgi:predicted transcriptional regulator